MAFQAQAVRLAKASRPPAGRPGWLTPQLCCNGHPAIAASRPHASGHDWASKPSHARGLAAPPAVGQGGAQPPLQSVVGRGASQPKPRRRARSGALKRGYSCGPKRARAAAIPLGRTAARLVRQAMVAAQRACRRRDDQGYPASRGAADRVPPRPSIAVAPAAGGPGLTEGGECVAAAFARAHHRNVKPVACEMAAPSAPSLAANRPRGPASIQSP